MVYNVYFEINWTPIGRSRQTEGARTKVGTGCSEKDLVLVGEAKRTNEPVGDGGKLTQGIKKVCREDFICNGGKLETNSAMYR